MIRPNRRRFIQIAAAMPPLLGMRALPTPARAVETVRWRGLIFGANARIVLHTDNPKGARRKIAQLQRHADWLERQFSLYRPQSTLSRLNRDGEIWGEQSRWLCLQLRRAGIHHRQSGGLFDPTVQSVWRLYRETDGEPSPDQLERAHDAIGFRHVAFEDGLFAPKGENPKAQESIKNPFAKFQRPDMGMTLNSLVQGQCTDHFIRSLKGAGFSDILVNCGEYAAGRGHWQIGIEDPQTGLIGKRTLRHGAMATSSPMATVFGPKRRSHIINPLDPKMPPLWSTVTVQSDFAETADVWSTILCFLPLNEIKRLAGRHFSSATLVDFDGNVRTIEA